MSFDFFFLNIENDFMRFYVSDGFCQVVPLFFAQTPRDIRSVDPSKGFYLLTRNPLLLCLGRA